MNNKGQSLVTFILILPIFALFIGFFIDTSLMALENNRVKEIVKDNIKYAIEKNVRDKDKIENVIKSNKNIDMFVTISDDDIIIVAKSTKKSIFSNILKINWLEKISYCGNYTSLEINKC